jgi:hypothetical protein
MRPLFGQGGGKVLAAAVVSAALFVPLAVFGGSALARSASAASEYQYSGSSQYQYSVQICHLTGSKKHPAHTITVSSAAVAAHLRHGDHLGPCTDSETSRNHGKRSATNPGQGQGNGNHGNGQGSGKGNGHH